MGLTKVAEPIEVDGMEVDCLLDLLPLSTRLWKAASVTG